MPIQTLIFDLGGVLIDWNPRHLYRKLSDDEAAIEHFLTHIATGDWNEQQDEGRSLAEATEWLLHRHPEHEEWIRAFYGRWPEMLNGPIPGTLDVLTRLRRHAAYPLYALTNWSAETWPVATERYDFLRWFDGILVSGHERMRKPQERFYRLLEERFPLQLSTSLFIDDNLRNVEAARAIGLRGIHFRAADRLEADLAAYGVQVP